MLFSQWLQKEAVIYQDDNAQIRDAQPNEIPRTFVHTTDNQADIDSIVQRGFDLSRFGQTARKYGFPVNVQYDPKGVYALAADEMDRMTPRPYVRFTAAINKAVVLVESHPGAGKRALAAYMGATGDKLSSQLLKMGYQAVLTPDSEQIILDPSIIRIVDHSSSP